MSENKLVGSLILRTIDIDPTRNAPTNLVAGNPVPFDNDYGSCRGNGVIIT